MELGQTAERDIYIRRREVVAMFFTQVIIPVLIVAGVCFWAGMRWEKERHIAQMRAEPVDAIPQQYDRRV